MPHARQAANSGRPRVPATSRGFTLIEILLVLALIGLVSTVLITGVSALDRTGDKKDAESIILEALSSARSAAVATGRIIVLRQDPDSRKVSWDGGSAVLPDDDTRVSLLNARRHSTFLIGGRLEETPVDFLRFYPDGTCDAFRLKISGANFDREIAIDPWTCAPLDLVVPK